MLKLVDSFNSWTKFECVKEAALRQTWQFMPKIPDTCGRRIVSSRSAWLCRGFEAGLRNLVRFFLKLKKTGVHLSGRVSRARGVTQFNGSRHLPSTAHVQGKGSLAAIKREKSMSKVAPLCRPVADASSLKGKRRLPSNSYQFSRRSRQMLGGPPMHAICCRLFQSASSSSVSVFCTYSIADKSPASSLTMLCLETQTVRRHFRRPHLTTFSSQSQRRSY